MRAAVASAMADPAVTDPVRYVRALEAAYDRVLAPLRGTGSHA
jgi:hypothetical protein